MRHKNTFLVSKKIQRRCLKLEELGSGEKSTQQISSCGFKTPSLNLASIFPSSRKKEIGTF